MYPKISIVTPNFNCVKFLEKTILSVIGQGYPNLEYIIIDGGSTDGSLDVVKKYQNHLSYWISEKDKGLYDALNKGFSKASGEIFMYINSDDCLVSGSLKLIGKCFFKYPDILWITGYYSWLNEDDEITKIERNKNWSIIDFLNGNYQWIQQESTVWRKETWQNAGGRFNTEYRYAADMALWCSFFLQSNPVIVDFSIGSFRVRNNQLSQTNILTYYAEANIAIQKLRQKTDRKILNLAKKHKLLLSIINFLIRTSILDNQKVIKYLENRKNKLRGDLYRVLYSVEGWTKIKEI